MLPLHVTQKISKTLQITLHDTSKFLNRYKLQVQNRYIRYILPKNFLNRQKWSKIRYFFEMLHFRYKSHVTRYTKIFKTLQITLHVTCKNRFP